MSGVVKRWRAAALAALVISAGVVVGFGARTASAQVTCALMVPTGLRPFCPGQPIYASTMNGNTAAILGWLETKLGPLDSPDVTVGELALGPGAVFFFTPGALVDGTVLADDVADDTVDAPAFAPGGLSARDLDPTMLGPGVRLNTSTDTLEVDRAALQGAIADALVATPITELSHSSTSAAPVATPILDAGGAPVQGPRAWCFLTRHYRHDEEAAEASGTHECRVSADAAGRYSLSVVAYPGSSAPASTTACAARCITW